MSKVKVIDMDVLEGKTVIELRELCKKYGIIGVSKARKDDILEAIDEFYGTLDCDDDSCSCAKPAAVVSDGGKVPYINATVSSFLTADDTYQTMISVSCGASSSNYPVVGKTVSFVKATYREILNIETDSKAVVNGEEVKDSYVLKSSDQLEFVRRAGEKG
jgi:hypothetical protein